MTLLSTCPKCGFLQSTPSDTCQVCGVIFSKLATARERPVPAPSFQASPAQMAPVPACQACHGPGPVAHAVFRRNIGALIARFEKRIEGRMCGACLGKSFWSYTLTTVAVGWLGMISLIVAPIYVIANIVSYTRALGQLRAQ